METQYISLNMTPTGVNPCFHISQYDVGRMLGFIVHSGGATVDLDTYTCTIEATRSDGTAITSAVATTDNIGTFEVTPTMSNKTDKYRCQLVIVDANSKRIASLPFDMEVTKAAMDENSEAIEEDASLYQQYTEAVQGAIAEANADIQAEENARIAAVNAEATARANADTTLQNNIDAEATARQTADNTLQGNINSEAATRASADSNLQSQINQIIAPSGEAPSAAEVQNARIGADGVTYSTLGDAIRANDNISKDAIIDITGNEFYPLIHGYYISLSDNPTDLVPHAASGRNCVKISCSAGDVFTVNGTATGSVALLWGFTKSNGTLIKVANPNLTLNNGILVAPTNAAFLVINTSSESGYVCKGIINKKRIAYVENGLEYNGFNPLMYEQGAINDGQETASSVMCRTVYVSGVDTAYISVKSGYIWNCLQYDNLMYTSVTNWQNGGMRLSLNPANTYRFVVGKFGLTSSCTSTEASNNVSIIVTQSKKVKECIDLIDDFNMSFSLIWENNGIDAKTGINIDPSTPSLALARTNVGAVIKIEKPTFAKIKMLNGTSWRLFKYNSGGTFMSVTNWNNDSVSYEWLDAGYIYRFGILNTTNDIDVTNIDNFIKIDFLSNNSIFALYDYIRTLFPVIPNKHYVVVDPSGNFDYTTIGAAIANEAEYTPIIVMPGVYNEVIDAKLKGICLYGIDRNRCILRSVLGYYNYSTLFVSAGYIENMTICAEYVQGESGELDDSNGAYAVHVDMYYSENKSLEFHHCTMKSDFNPAVGIGLRAGFKLIFDDCVLENNQIAGRGKYSDIGTLGALYFHNAQSSQGMEYITVKNCTMKSKLENAMCIYDSFPDNANGLVTMDFINNVIFSEISGQRTNNIYFRLAEGETQDPITTGRFIRSGLCFGNSNNLLNYPN